MKTRTFLILASVTLAFHGFAGAAQVNPPPRPPEPADPAECVYYEEYPHLLVKELGLLNNIPLFGYSGGYPTCSDFYIRSGARVVTLWEAGAVGYCYSANTKDDGHTYRLMDMDDIRVVATAGRQRQEEELRDRCAAKEGTFLANPSTENRENLFFSKYVMSPVLNTEQERSYRTIRGVTCCDKFLSSPRPPEPEPTPKPATTPDESTSVIEPPTSQLPERDPLNQKIGTPKPIPTP